MSPSSWIRVGPGVTWRQRDPGFEPFQFDTRSRACSQQPVGRLAQSETTLLGVFSKRRIERREKRGYIAIDSAAQLMVDERTAVLANRVGIAWLLRCRTALRHGE